LDEVNIYLTKKRQEHETRSLHYYGFGCTDWRSDG
jgi:hypothetical protein